MSDVTTDESAFQFIVSRGPRVDPGARKTIRRQAMKDVGLARRRENQSRASKKQPAAIRDITTSPRSDGRNLSSSASWSSTFTWLTSETSTPSTEPTEIDDTEATVQSQSVAFGDQCPTLHPNLTHTIGDYSYMRSASSIDLPFLTVLTDFNISRSTISSLACSPFRLPALFSHRQWSYLDYIPQRYSHSPCLAAATDCILAKVQNFLSPGLGGDRSVLRLYAKALRLVQDAVASSSCADPDVLCAVLLLSLHELFDVSSSGAWASHIEGSAKLIRYRSASRFETAFEKALFAASVGPYVSECLYNGTHCYLAALHWRELYLSLAEHTVCLSERSELVIGLRAQMFSLPGLWSDVGSALEGDGLFNDDVLSALAQRCREAAEGYLSSLEAYKTYVVRTALSQPSTNELVLRREVFGLAHEGLILVKRFQASVCDADRSELEDEVRDLAQSILDLQDVSLPERSWLFSGHEYGIAQLALDTSYWFSETNSTATWEERRLAMRTRYSVWSGSLRAF